MKNLVFTLLFVLLGTAGVMAQDAAKKCAKKSTACCASKAKTMGTASVDADQTKVLSDARALADKDENISTRICATSGSVGFYKKAVCSQSGKVSYNEVKYDDSAKQFVNVSPNDIGDSNSAKLIKVVNTENAVMSDTKVNTAKKACTKGKKACCSSKKVKATEGTEK